MMLVFVKSVEGKVWNLQVDARESIGSAKQKLAAASGIDVWCQRLIYAGNKAALLGTCEKKCVAEQQLIR